MLILDGNQCKDSTYNENISGDGYTDSHTILTCGNLGATHAS